MSVSVLSCVMHFVPCIPVFTVVFLRYLPLAGQIANAFFGLESLFCISVLYRYSLNFFMGVFFRALEPSVTEKVDPTDYDARGGLNMRQVRPAGDL